MNVVGIIKFYLRSWYTLATAFVISFFLFIFFAYFFLSGTGTGIPRGRLPARAFSALWKTTAFVVDFPYMWHTLRETSVLSTYDHSKGDTGDVAYIMANESYPLREVLYLERARQLGMPVADIGWELGRGLFVVLKKPSSWVTAPEEKISALERLIQEAGDSEFQRSVFQLVDKESFYAESIALFLSEASLTQEQKRAGWYYDQVTQKLYQAVRAVPWFHDLSFDPETQIFSLNADALSRRVFAIPEFARERNERLVAYVTSLETFQKEQQYLEQTWKEVRGAWYRVPDPVVFDRTLTTAFRAMQDRAATQIKNAKRMAEQPDVSVLLEQEAGLRDLHMSVNVWGIAPAFIDSMRFALDPKSTWAPAGLLLNGRPVCAVASGSGKHITVESTFYTLRCDRLDLVSNIMQMAPPEQANIQAFNLSKAVKTPHRFTLEVSGEPRFLEIQSLEITLKNSFTGKAVPGVSILFADYRPTSL